MIVNSGKDFKYRERGKLIDALGLTELTDKKSPLLSEIMRLSKVMRKPRPHCVFYPPSIAAGIRVEIRVPHPVRGE